MTPETPTILTFIINPPTEFADPEDPLDDNEPKSTEPNITSIHAKTLLAFTTKIIFDLFPHDKTKTQTAIQDASKAIFKMTPHFNHSSHRLLLTFDA
ncbi:hypothetical protein Zmor_028362 [Zophobas morio]|uniref:Uncharacterized protein n=1 Tax=Zophobas morio TaxID=2755281 RepID=A0AA38HSK5_9CUCU|nr:hypothetical protein Zmor_028362 [Zophobas morio]